MIMSILEMSDEEKKKIREQHDKATKEFYNKMKETKKGLQGLKQVPKKEEPKKVVPKKK